MPAMHVVSAEVEQYWADSWGSPVGHAVGQLGRFDFPMKVRVSKPVTPSLMTGSCRDLLDTLTDSLGRRELFPCTAGCAASTVGAKGRSDSGSATPHGSREGTDFNGTQQGVSCDFSYPSV